MSLVDGIEHAPTQVEWNWILHWLRDLSHRVAEWVDDIDADDSLFHDDDVVVSDEDEEQDDLEENIIGFLAHETLELDNCVLEVLRICEDVDREKVSDAELFDAFYNHFEKLHSEFEEIVATVKRSGKNKEA